MGIPEEAPWSIASGVEAAPAEGVGIVALTGRGRVLGVGSATTERFLGSSEMVISVEGFRRVLRAVPS